MMSLYVKFLILVIAFICVSLSLHWLPWSLGTKERSLGAKERSKRVNMVEKPVPKGPLIFKKPCIGDHCILKKNIVKTTTRFFVNPDSEKQATWSKPEVEHPTKRFSLKTVKKISKLYNKLKSIKQDMKVHKMEKLNVTHLKSKGSTNIVERAKSDRLFGLQYADMNILSKAGIKVMDEGRVGIWNTKSGKDRILEQMAFIPEMKDGTLGRSKGILLDGGIGNWGVQYGDQTFKDHKCRVQNCEILQMTDNNGDVDAVLFGQMLPNMEHYLQNYRKPHIVWLFFALESPMATLDYSSYKDYINWTATYRSDSTIVAPYEKWVYHFNESVTNTKVPSRNYAKGKSKMAAIFVSNCAGSNERLYYVYDLQKNISVDIYGFCGPHKCPRNSNKCSKMLNKDYKFYLAFENANCKDYITEKFFMNALQHDVIPIVMGARREEYEKLAPKNSFIHVEDFKSAEELAIYLQKLDQNDDLYNEYFKWKGTGSFLNTKFWCRLCAMLNDNNKPTLFVNLEEWWRASDTCTRSRWDKLKKQRNSG